MRELNPIIKIELPAKILDGFFKQFEPLNKKVPGLASRLLDYMLEGKETGAFGDLRKIHDAAEIMNLGLYSGISSKESQIREAGFYNQRYEPLELYFRLSQIWENAGAMLARNTVFAGLPNEGRWLEMFLWEFQGRRIGTYSSEYPPTVVSADDIEQLFIWRCQPADWLVRSGFYLLDNQRRYRSFMHNISSYFLGIPNMGAAYVQHKAIVAESLQQKDHIAREETLDILGKFEEALEPFSDLWAECAVNSAKGIRERAVALMLRTPASTLVHIQKWACDGSSAQRGLAIDAIAKVYKNEAREFLINRLSAENSPTLKGVIQEAIDNLPAIESEVVSVKAIIEEELPLSPIVPLDESAKEALRTFAVSYKELAATLPAYPNRKLSFTDDEVAEVICFLESFTFDQVELLKSRTTGSFRMIGTVKCANSTLVLLSIPPSNSFIFCDGRFLWKIVGKRGLECSLRLILRMNI